ncbi:hypothetical protein T10_8144 [Trichinella papuae]|uniref:Uncharacterized protein n=1 Tax=Trichinella papuae TaxID=268474 RepID=A0A0V1MNK5_9BILA|nr:hypothetical protein T10_8144 [Trichinella papuae]
MTKESEFLFPTYNNENQLTYEKKITRAVWESEFIHHHIHNLTDKWQIEWEEKSNSICKTE